MLRGRLHIYGLQRVKGIEEATKAKISAKSSIRELGFHWDYQAEVGEDTDIDNQQHVLEGLQPHGNIQGLILKNFGGKMFPLWTASLRNLVKIELRGCSLCKQVPSLGDLPLLEIIEMVELNNLECIGSEFYGNNVDVAFQALRKLTLDRMPMLEEWSADMNRPAVCFSNLEELCISGCPKFINIPCHLFSIKELTISSIKRSDAESGMRCHPCLIICSTEWNSANTNDLLEKSSESLRNLTLRGLDELRHSPNKLWSLASLKKLEIIECSNLDSDSGGEGFNSQIPLQQVSVKHCKSLRYLPKGLLQKTIVTFELNSCPSLIEADLLNLTSLMNLTISGCPS